MPNWCQNKLEITFSESQREALHNALFSTDEANDLYLDFRRLLPIPESLDLSDVWGDHEKLEARCQHNLKHHGYTDWYDWCINQWGCKWNASSTYLLSNEEEHLCILFDTPWSPPEFWFRSLCEAFPDIDASLSYWEPGIYFAGDIFSVGEGDCYHKEIDECEIKQFAIDIFGAEFEEDEEE